MTAIGRLELGTFKVQPLKSQLEHLTVGTFSAFPPSRDVLWLTLNRLLPEWAERKVPRNILKSSEN
ncbi:MAG TPA: hypothetical protein VGN44_13110, partial [Candidatus Angelobacter sp.]